MTFPQFIFILIGAFITAFVWHYIIRSAVSAGILDARNKVAKQRDELRALKGVEERKRRPSKTRDSFQSPTEGNQILNR